MPGSGTAKPPEAAPTPTPPPTRLVLLQLVQALLLLCEVVALRAQPARAPEEKNRKEGCRWVEGPAGYQALRAQPAPAPAQQTRKTQYALGAR